MFLIRIVNIPKITYIILLDMISKNLCNKNFTVSVISSCERNKIKSNIVDVWDKNLFIDYFFI